MSETKMTNMNQNYMKPVLIVVERARKLVLVVGVGGRKLAQVAVV
jgi:hypothetical protein